VVAATLAALLHRRLMEGGWDRRLRGVIWFVELSSLFVVLALALSFVARWQPLLAVAWTLTGFQLLAALLGVVRITLHRSGDPVRRRIARQLARPPLLVHALAIAFSIGLPAWSLLAHQSDLEALAGVPAFVLFAGLAAAIAWRSARALATGGDPRRTLARLLARDLPLLLLPIALVAANEVQYLVSRFSVTTIAIVLLGGVVALVPLLARLCGRARLPTARRLAFALYLPIVVTALALVTAHVHWLSVGELDAFHLGERSLPAHQLLRFGVVPLIDLRLTHTLSDLVYPGLYTLLHGFRPGEHALGMLLFMRWMPAVVAMPLLYWLLASATTPLFALLACVAAPVLTLMDPYYGMALVLALLLGRFARRPGAAALAWVWLGVLWLLAWRIDFGLAGGIATLLVLGARSLSGPRLDRRALGRSLAPAFAGALVALFGLALLSTQPLIPALVHLVQSYTYRLATRVRAEIIADYDMLAALQYYLLPAAGIAVVLAFVGRRLLGTGRVRSSRYPLLFLALFSLVISVRSLERHSLIESFNGYLFFLLLVLLPAFVTAEARAATRRRALAVVLALFFLRLLLMLPPAGPATGSYAFAELLPGRHGFALQEWQGDEVRYAFDPTPFADALAFLERHLEEGDTFFDFTNSPALFVIADRRFPTWMIPTLAATSETVQSRLIGELESWRAERRLPFVVFKQGNYWDAFEAVNSEVRSYRIAEWIHRHYRPLVRLRGFELWQDLREEPIPIDWRTVIDLPIRERIAGPSIEVTRLSRRSGLAVRTGSGDPHLYGFLGMRNSPQLSTRDRWTLEIEGRSSVGELFQVFYQLEGEEFTDERSFKVLAEALEEGESQVWVLPLEEPVGVIVDLRIDPPENAELEIQRVTLTGTTDGVVGLVEDAVSQSYDLQSLPRVWAELDPLRASSTTPLVATLLDSPVLVRPGTGSISLPLDPALDRQAVGYALLRVRSARNLLEPPRGDVRLYLRYDRDDCCGFVFDLAASADESVDYLVRLASQWRWSHGEVASLRLWTTAPAVLERVELRGVD
jgi:hypothetical protein